jgi:hypothetical protein
MVKTAYTINELIEVGPLGRTSIYEAIRSGQLIARKFGNRTFVLAADFEKFLNSLPQLSCHSAERAA